MKQSFKGWDQVAENLRTMANAKDVSVTHFQLNEGQRATLRAIADRIPHNGLVVADEVGMGKTRIAVAVARCVELAGGRVAILVPPGLGYQWGDELRKGGVDAPDILRSLWQYLIAWESEDPAQQKPWFDHDVVLISHAFTNWRLGAKSDPWRWSLLPDLYIQRRQLATGRLPRRTDEQKAKSHDTTRNAAASIAGAISGLPDGHPVRELFSELADIPWPGALMADTYARDQSLRPRLEDAVGLGLGLFDLVIIDEAHKSRGEESGLSRLCEHVVLASANARRLSVTATPVELDVEQWKPTLARIQVDTSKIEPAIAIYSEAVRRVRRYPSDEAVRRGYETASKVFENALKPFLLRRDKREDHAVKRFAERARVELHAYRREAPISIDPAKLPEPWNRVICAAEALSQVTRIHEDAVAKRLRLTIGNGHGLSDLIDSTIDGVSGESPPSATEQIASDAEPLAVDKRAQRALWWRDVIKDAFPDVETALYSHPATLEAVDAIERANEQNEKVLVFGRFTRPMQVLVRLLNAREMLRCIDTGRHWPQQRLPDDDNIWKAVYVAHQQLKRAGTPNRMLLNEQLASQYEGLEKERRRYRESFVTNLESGILLLTGNRLEIERVIALFHAFRQSLENNSGGGEGTSALAVVANAMRELSGADTSVLTPRDYADAFVELVRALSDRDDGDEKNGDGKLDSLEAVRLWAALKQRLDDEYSTRQGNFARLLFGETKPETRRYLQLSFNRRASHPRVLVAQSLVGREGLNLHEACRIVVLLHPEWNPGVVEQQIGRVDRLGSWWQRQLDKAIHENCPAEALPRIEVWPVIFKGTYDEQNWQVLRSRWDELRAQLHGVVISDVGKSLDTEILKAINLSAPNFSPTPQTSASG